MPMPAFSAVCGGDPIVTGTRRFLLYCNICLMVSLEFVQNSAVFFSAAAITRGLGATPEQFSLAAAVYAACAVVMIALHQWLAERLGYRNFIRLALLLFAVGALLCALSVTPSEFIAARFVQALGGSAFFTAARVQVNRFTGAQRGLAMRIMVVGIITGSSLGIWWASLWLHYAAWPAVFLASLPLVAVVIVLSELTLLKAAAEARKSRAHLGGTLLLAASVLMLQFTLERSQYEFFSSAATLLCLSAVALLGLTAFIRLELKRRRPLLMFRHFMDSHYGAGLGVYTVCYLLNSSAGYMLSVQLQQGLGFSVLTAGALIGFTSWFALAASLAHFHCLPRYPAQRKYFIFVFATLGAAGWALSRVGPDASPQSLILPLLLLAAFSGAGQGTAGYNTFRNVNEEVFSHAYQFKNMLRELLNSSGISLATVLLQSRWAEHVQEIGPLPGQHGAAGAELFNRQATWLAGADFFRLLMIVAAVGLAGTLLGAIVRRYELRSA